MKAITIWQPWATLIAEGAKQFEFRAWPAPRQLVGQRIAIHAGARPVKMPEVKELLYRLQRGEPMGIAIGPALTILRDGMHNDFPLRSVLCTAILGKPLRDAELAKAIGADWSIDSDRAEHSNWGWPLSDVHRLEPFVPATGAQGFWNWEMPT